MGIYDREYAARPAPRGKLSVTMWLIIINCVVFLFTAFPINGLGWPMIQDYSRVTAGGGTLTEDTSRYYLPNGAPATSRDLRKPGTDVIRILRDAEGKPAGKAEYEVVPALFSWGHFSTMAAFLQLQVWRLVTFQFLHGSLLHIAFNMVGLWMMGRPVEENLGARKYLAFYLMCGICGGLMYLILNGLGNIMLAVAPTVEIPGLLFNRIYTPLVGASAGVFGVIMACAYLSPETQVQLLFPPIALKMRTFAYAYVLIALVSLLWGTANAGGEAAHVGGAIAGYFFIRNSHLLRDFFDVFTDSRRARGGGGGAKTKDKKPLFFKSEAEKDKEFQKQVDEVLDKVRTKGMHTLSEKEKKILQEATRREQ